MGTPAGLMLDVDDKIEEDVNEATGAVEFRTYTERRLEPPHISVLLPEQIILQSVSAAAAAIIPSELPQ